MKKLMTLILCSTLGLNAFAFSQTDADNAYNTLLQNPNVQRISEGCMTTTEKRITLLSGNPLFTQSQINQLKTRSILECEYGTTVVKAANCQSFGSNKSCKTVDLKVIYPDDLNKSNTTIKTNNIY